MTELLDRPLLSIAIVLVLALLDYPLTIIAQKMYKNHMSRYVEYHALKGKRKPAFGILWFVIKIIIGLLLYGIWIIYNYGEIEIVGIFYLWLVGFAIGSYFIINLRHIESILLSRLYRNTDSVQGSITYYPKISVKISAVQFFSMFIIFCLLLIISPGFFTLGLACAPLFLTARNLLLS